MCIFLVLLLVFCCCYCFFSPRECSAEVMSCQFNPEGTVLAVGLNNGTIKVWKRNIPPSISSYLQIWCWIIRCGLFFHVPPSLLSVLLQLYDPESGDFMKTIRDSSCYFASMPVTSIRFARSAQSNSLLLATCEKTMLCTHTSLHIPSRSL